MRGQERAGVPSASDELHHTWREAGFSKKRRQSQHTKGRLLGRLEDERVTCCEGWGHLPPDVHERGIPGRNARADSKWFVSHELGESVVFPEGLAGDLVSPTCVVFMCGKRSLVSIIQESVVRENQWSCLHLKTCTICAKSKWIMPAIGRPVGRDSAYASRSTFFSTRSANLFRHAERWIPVNLAHGPFRNASLPRATARSTSSLLATGTSSATTESSTGLSNVNLSPRDLTLSTNCFDIG